MNNNSETINYLYVEMYPKFLKEANWCAQIKNYKSKALEPFDIVGESVLEVIETVQADTKKEEVAKLVMKRIVKKSIQESYYNRTSIDIDAYITYGSSIFVDSFKKQSEQACSKCKELLPVGMFYNDVLAGTMLVEPGTICRLCKSVYNKDWFAKKQAAKNLTRAPRLASKRSIRLNFDNEVVMEEGGGKYKITGCGKIIKVGVNNDKLLKYRIESKDNESLVELTVGKSTRTFSVKRLVAKYFIENPDNLIGVGYKDGNKRNLNAGNLYYKKSFKIK